MQQFGVQFYQASLTAKDIDKATPMTKAVDAAYVSAGVPYLSIAEIGITQELRGGCLASKAAETEGRGKARRTPERAGRSPGAQRASASDGGGRRATGAIDADGAEAARRRASVGSRHAEIGICAEVRGGCRSRVRIAPQREARRVVQ